MFNMNQNNIIVIIVIVFILVLVFNNNKDNKKIVLSRKTYPTKEYFKPFQVDEGNPCNISQNAKFDNNLNCYRGNCDSKYCCQIQNDNTKNWESKPGIKGHCYYSGPSPSI